MPATTAESPAAILLHGFHLLYQPAGFHTYSKVELGGKNFEKTRRIRQKTSLGQCGPAGLSAIRSDSTPSQNYSEPRATVLTMSSLTRGAQMMLAPKYNQMKKDVYMYIYKISGSWFPRMGSQVGQSNPLPSQVINMMFSLLIPEWPAIPSQTPRALEVLLSRLSPVYLCLIMLHNKATSRLRGLLSI